MPIHDYLDQDLALRPQPGESSVQGEFFKTNWCNTPNMHLTNFSRKLVRLQMEALKNDKVIITNDEMVEVLVQELYIY